MEYGTCNEHLSYYDSEAHWFDGQLHNGTTEGVDAFTGQDLEAGPRVHNWMVANGTEVGDGDFEVAYIENRDGEVIDMDLRRAGAAVFRRMMVEKCNELAAA